MFTSSSPSSPQGAFSGWAPGAGNYSFPSDAGLPFGTMDTVVWIVLQVHYNNPSLIGGQYDVRITCNIDSLMRLQSSGFEFTYTSQLRQYDVGSYVPSSIS